jgi:hypothetical protein
LFPWPQHSKAVTGYHGFNPGTDAIVMGCGAHALQRPAAFARELQGVPPPGLYGDIHPGKMAGCNVCDVAASIVHDGLMKPAGF